MNIYANQSKTPISSRQKPIIKFFDTLIITQSGEVAEESPLKKWCIQGFK